MWFPVLIHMAPFISISPAFTGLPRRLSVSVGLREMGLTQERNTFTAPFSFDVIRNSIPSKWVFQISQQSLKMSRDPLLSCAAHTPLHSLQFRTCVFLRSWGCAERPEPFLLVTAAVQERVFSVSTRDSQIFVLNLKRKQRFRSENVSCIFVLKSQIYSHQEQLHPDHKGAFHRCINTNSPESFTYSWLSAQTSHSDSKTCWDYVVRAVPSGKGPMMKTALLERVDSWHL